jgi:hypothetical protein
MLPQVFDQILSSKMGKTADQMWSKVLLYKRKKLVIEVTCFLCIALDLAPNILSVV